MSELKKVDRASPNDIKQKENEEEEEEDDVISKAIGEFGKWQLLHTFLLSLFNIPSTFHMYAPTYHVGEKRDTWCARPEGFENVSASKWMKCTGQSEDDYCNMYDITGYNLANYCNAGLILDWMKCTEWEYGGDGSTIISDFNLVCDKKNLPNIAQMLFLAGSALGGLANGILSDKFGRKKTLMTLVTIQTIIGIVITFSPGFWFYAIFRAVLGFVSVSIVFTGFVLAIELVGGKWKTITGLSYLIPTSLSYVFVSGIAWFLRDWRYFQLAISLTGLLFFGHWWIIPESPRWLLAKGKIREVMVLCDKAAKFNNMQPPSNLQILLKPEADNEPIVGVSVLDIVRTSKMRKITFCQLIIWYCVILVYYGVTLNISNIGGNLYLNSALQGIVEIPAITLAIYILLKKGRRMPFAISTIIAGIASLLTIPIYFIDPDLQWPITTLTMISKLCISASNAIMPVFAAELYPIKIRSIGVGAANVTAGIALMCVPYLWLLTSVHTSFPMTLLGICGLLGGFVVILLPETKKSQ